MTNKNHEDDLKRAQTNIKSACSDDPGSVENRNPLFNPEVSTCDLNVEPADPKAPPQASNLYTGEKGKQAPESDELKNYDEKVRTWGGEDK